MKITLLLLFLGFSTLLLARTIEPAIQSVRINGQEKPFNSKTPLQLSALDDDLIIQLHPEDGVNYHFFLENYDKFWVSSLYPIIRYTNLSGGNYILKVKALHNNRKTATLILPIIIESSLTEEWWFLPSVIIYSFLLLGAGIYFFLLYNFREKLKVETIRQKIASDLHDEVGATLSSISIATRVVQKKLGQQINGLDPVLEQIKTDSEDTIQTIRDTVWAINPENDSVELLFEKMRTFALQILTVQNISLDFNNEYQAFKTFKMSMEQRRNVYLMYKEAINNIAKHSDATKVSVIISKAKDGFKLLISDNGKGFDYQEVYEGNGLKNFKKRAATSFMEFSLDSTIGKGTSLEIMVFEV